MRVLNIVHLPARPAKGLLLVVQYRIFKNGDPPGLVEIWNEAFVGRGAARLRHSSVLERFVFAKPYFDPAGLIVAEKDGQLLGFAHAGFGPNQRETVISKSTGVTMIGMKKTTRKKFRPRIGRAQRRARPRPSRNCRLTPTTT